MSSRSNCKLILVSSSALLFALVVAASCPAQPIADLEQRLEKLCKKLDEQRIQNKIPGAAISVVYRDKVVLARGFGLRDIDKKLPVEPETLFAVGSTTKAFTCALVCMLEADGKLSLDDPVSKHVANFKLKDKKANDSVLVRDLLCHRTGLTRMGILWAGGTLTPEEILEHVSQAEPYRPFRSAFLYNNVMYLIAGMAVSNASQSDWHRLVKTRILEPLGMTSSNTSIVETEKLPTASKGYSWNDVDESWDREDMRDLTSAAPAGAINSSVVDMAQWVRFQLAKGRIGDTRLLDEKAFDEMWKTHNQIAPQIRYGLGWMLRQWNEKRVVEHGGNIDGFCAQVALLPQEQLGFCFVANVSATPLQQNSIKLVFDALLGEAEAEKDPTEAESSAKATPSEDELQRYIGKYHFAAMKADMTVLIKEGRLALDVPGQTTFVLKWPNADGRWVFELADEIEISFEDPEDGKKVPAITMYQSGMTFRMPRAEKPKDLPSIEDILELRGKTGLFEAAGEHAHTRSRGSVHFVHQGASGRFETISSGNRVYRVVDLGKIGKIKTAFDGKRAFEQTFNDDAKELTGKELLVLAQERTAATFGDWRSHWTKVEVTRKREYRGNEIIVVQVTNRAGETNDIYVDAKTGRIAGRRHMMHQNGISLQMETYYEYEDASARLPFRHISVVPQSGDVILEIETYETGLAAFDASMFVLETE